MGIFDFFKNNRGKAAIEVDTSKASKGQIRNSWYSGLYKDDGQPSPESLNLILKLYQDDPVVQSAISTRTDAILASGWTLEGSKTATNSGYKTLEKVNFDYPFLEKVVSNALLYEHVFIEIEKTITGVVANLHILETPYMEINHDAQGTINSFIEKPESGSPIEWLPEEIVYYKNNSISSAVWGETALTSLYRTLESRNLIEKFINALAQTNAWQQVIKTNMSEDNITEWLPYYAHASQDPTSPLIMRSDSNDKVIDESVSFDILRDPSDLKEFLGVLDYFRTQTLMLLKVPPIMIGLPDSSNRSNSESQIKAFNLANEAIRKKLSDKFNQELFKRLGITAKFSWNPIDERSEKDDVEIAEKLMNMGAKPKQVEAFLRNAGLELPDGELFDPEANIKKSDDQFPSRQGKADGEPNKKIGTGSDGTTRDDQLK